MICSELDCFFGTLVQRGDSLLLVGRMSAQAALVAGGLKKLPWVRIRGAQRATIVARWCAVGRGSQETAPTLAAIANSAEARSMQFGESWHRT